MGDPWKGLEIVRASAQVLAVDKPVGSLTIPGRGGAADPRPCLIHEIQRRFPGRIWIVHRLDFEVSGLLLFARSPEAHRLLCGILERRGAVKRYEAWTEGDPPGRAGAELVWEDRILRGKRRAYASPHGKPSRTVAVQRGAVEWRGRRLLRWEMRPETGRPHQIRFQAAARAFPVAGDTLYGSTVSFLPDTIALRAVSLEFRDASDDELGLLDLPRRLEAAPAAARWT